MSRIFVVPLIVVVAVCAAGPAEAGAAWESIYLEPSPAPGAWTAPVVRVLRAPGEHGWAASTSLRSTGKLLQDGELSAETEQGMREGVGASAAELAKQLVRWKTKLKRAKRAVGWGIAGLIVGPILIITGAVLIVTVIGALAGIVILITGAVWTAFGLPALIAGSINKARAKRRIDEIEARLEVLGELGPNRRGPARAELLRFEL